MANIDNNTSALQEILAKVNALPEAGSGGGGSGGGGSVETCTVTFISSSPLDESTFNYTDGKTFETKIATTASSRITVPVNTIMAIEGWSSMDEATGECEEIFSWGGNAAYWILGDCTFNKRD